MERKTGGRIGSTGADNLIAKLYPQPDSMIVELETPGKYKRGTVLTLEEDGKYEVLGTGSGTASVVLADDTETEDESAVVYRSGHFNRNALRVAGEYTLSAKDENNLRLAGIFLSDMLGVAEDVDTEAEKAAYAMSGRSGGAGIEIPKEYTEEELGAMTIDKIKKLAEESGYPIKKTAKSDIIAEFLAAQKEEKENG